MNLTRKRSIHEAQDDQEEDEEKAAEVDLAEEEQEEGGQEGGDVEDGPNADREEPRDVGSDRPLSDRHLALFTSRLISGGTPKSCCLHARFSETVDCVFQQAAILIDLAILV